MPAKINGVDIEALRKAKEEALKKTDAPNQPIADTKQKLCVAVAGLETRIKSKTRFYWTFYNNCMTWVKDRKKGNVCHILDCRTFYDDPNPAFRIMKQLQRINFTYGGIDELMISSHSDWEGLYLFSKIRKELPEYDRYILPQTKWDLVEFNPGAKIWLQGCQTAGQYGKIKPDSICQAIANKTGCRVYGYASKAAQKLRDGGFYPTPDIGDYHEFLPHA